MIRLVAPVAVACFISACATSPGGPTAVAQLTPTRGNAVTGQVQFMQSGDRVRVTGEIRGLRPNAEHGFHVHEKGDCSSGDGLSAGGHFNPDGRAHGAYDHPEHHAGDLPSLKADASGNARISFNSGTLSVGNGKADLVGRGLIVHRDPDDFNTQPTGNAGPRLACAVITKS